MKQVIADSTFYILFYNDIYDTESLYCILKKYHMYIGNRLKHELRHHISKDSKFLSLINDKELDVDIGELLKNFYEFLLVEYPDYVKDINDGEYEVMGISYLFKQSGSLDYLIIDDKYAYNFVLKNLNYIKENLVRTIGFLSNGCKKDKILEIKFVKDILNKIEKSIDNGKNPLYITKDVWNKEIKPTILDLLEESCK
jgi:hypothetical protein